MDSHKLTTTATNQLFPKLRDAYHSPHCEGHARVNRQNHDESIILETQTSPCV
jgi:hypothetical protein